MRNLQLPGRSPVVCRGGTAATSHPLSTSEAIRILRKGGTAVDAAIAAAAVQGVVEPYSTSIGGDCFAMVHIPDGRIAAINGSGRLPAAFDADAVRSSEPDGIGSQSPHAATVPGAIAAWSALSRDYGALDFSELLEAATGYARDGYAVTPRVAHDWANRCGLLASETEAARCYLPGGEPPQAGSVHKQPDLARSLERIAKNGSAAFYEGEIAEAIVKDLSGRGGFHQLQDFAAYEPEYVKPVSGSYRGHRVFECPPNGQGIIALIMMHILERFDLGPGEADDVQRVHLVAEATRLAYDVRAARLGDPSQCAELVEEALSDQFADRLAGRISTSRAGKTVPAKAVAEHKDTVYICVADGSGMLASLINSVFEHFAGGIVASGTGILLHNRGMSFSLDKGHPNEALPGRRPMHTIIPAIAVDPAGDPMAFGVMGGHYQAVGHAQFMMDTADLGMDPQEALTQPRSFLCDGVLSVETPHRHLLEGLRELGHDAREADGPIGGGQAIRMCMVDGGPVFIAGSDHRKDGMASGY